MQATSRSLGRIGVFTYMPMEVHLASISHWQFSKSHRLDKKAAVANIFRKKRVSTRKEESYKVRKTPTMEPFSDYFPEKLHEPIEIYYSPKEQALNAVRKEGIPSQERNETDKATEKGKEKEKEKKNEKEKEKEKENEKEEVTLNASTEEEMKSSNEAKTTASSDDKNDGAFEYKKKKQKNSKSRPIPDLWPNKTWIWRSAINFNGKSFDNQDHKHLEWFVDDTNNSVGRAWYTSELRLKSNHDLWRLWYVLLRERNMLNTMRLQCRVSKRLMPNYGRLKKVKKSMDRLMQIWNERAYIKSEALRRERTMLEEEARMECINNRRLSELQKREQIKQMFFEFVERHKKQLSQSQYDDFINRRNTTQEFLFLQNKQIPATLDAVKREATEIIQECNATQVFDKDGEAKAKEFIRSNFGHLIS